MRAHVAAALLTTISAFDLVAAKAKKQQLPCPKDPFADPHNDPCNPLRYVASNVLTAIAFSLIMAVALAQTVLMFRRGAKWMSAMTIGAYCFAAGIGCRFGLHALPDSKGIYIAEYLFVVLSPCAFIAADYVLLGRLARHLQSDRHLLIRPQRIVLFFVMSDVTTFLIQAAGGSVLISATAQKTIDNGNHIFLAGLALQLASFATFTVIYLVFLYRVHKHEPEQWARDAGKPWYSNWHALAGALSLSCVGILIRSVYRCIEISQGFRGRLGTSEGFFYGLDTLPLFISISVYVLFWPGRFIPLSSADDVAEKTSQETMQEQPNVARPSAEKPE